MNFPAEVTLRDTREVCDETLARYEALIVRLGKWFAKGDETLADDLAQLGRIVLWELEPSRFDEGDSGYLFRAILWTMQREVRRRRPLFGRWPEQEAA